MIPVKDVSDPTVAFLRQRLDSFLKYSIKGPLLASLQDCWDDKVGHKSYIGVELNVSIILYRL